MIDFLTAEHYEIAERNGISKKRAYARVNDDGWEIERAITEPVRKMSEYKDRQKWLKVARKNGITDNAFYLRVHKGWAEERATTEKLITGKEKIRVMHEAKARSKNENTL